MADKIFRVLFLSRRNSARSIMAEAVLNGLKNPNFVAYSAGIEPAADIDLETLELLQQAGLSTDGLYPKHFSQFGVEGARELDFVFTLHDEQAGEPMPQWPGVPVTAHWQSSDPVQAKGELVGAKTSVLTCSDGTRPQAEIFTNLPLLSLDRMSVQHHVDDIGRTEEKH